MKFTKNCIVICVVLLVSACAVKIETQNTQNLQVYYKKVRLAEDFILKQDFDKAAKYYRKAFENKHQPFHRDLVNAAYAEAKSSNPCKKTTQGISREIASFHNMNLYRGFQHFDDVDENLFKLTDTIYPSAVNQEAVRIIRELMKKDQEIRRVEGVTIAEMREVDSLNIIQFKELMQTANILNERTIFPENLMTLFTHWLRYDNALAYFEPVLLQAVRDGVFDARLFAKLIDNRSYDIGIIPRMSSFSTYGSQFFFFYRYRGDCKKHGVFGCKFYAFSTYDKHNPEHVRKLKQMDENRAEIYLGKTIEDNIRDFKLHKLKWSEDFDSFSFLVQSFGLSLIGNRGHFMESMTENRDTIQDFIFYITGEHDFDKKSAIRNF